MPKSNAIHTVKLHQKQEAVVNLQLHCTRPALSQYCKIFKGLQRDEKIAKFTSTYNKMERMATNKRRKAETVKRNSKGVRTDKSEKYQITHFLNYLKRTACTFSSLAKDDVMQ